MSFTENSSPLFLNESNGHVESDENPSPYDIIEHDVTSLAKVTNLPLPDTFDALQTGSDR